LASAEELEIESFMIDSSMLAGTVLDELRRVIDLMNYPDRPEITFDEKWAEWSEHYPVPDEYELQTVIEQAFWATLLAEEGQPLRFRLVMHDSEKDLHLVGVHEFEEPIPLLPRRLKKLVAAHDMSGSFLVIAIGSASPRVTGIGIERTGQMDPGEFTIEATGPGTLEFSWGIWRLVRFSSGQIERVSQVPMVNDGYQRIVGPLFGAGAYLMLYVGDILKSVRNHGHGGALWVVRDNQVDVKVKIGFPLAPIPYEWIQGGAPIEDRRRWAESIGQLSSTDGAVVINQVGQTLGFGAFVALDESLQIRRMSAPDKSEVVPADTLGGGRHRSAAAFCALHQPSMAIVVSEDGGISVFVHAEGNTVTDFYPWSPLGTKL